MSIIALWAGDQVGGPTQTEVLAGITSHLGGDVNVTEELPCDDPDLAWGIVVEAPSHPVPMGRLVSP